MRSAAQRARALTRGVVAALALLAGALLAWGMFRGEDDEIEARTADDGRGYYLTRATLTEMGVDGTPRIVLRAESIEQRLADQNVYLTDLSVDYNTANAGNWTVTSDRGRLLPDASSLRLSGNVVVRGTETRGTAIIRTDELTYDTKANVVQTAEPVDVEFGPHTLRARGLRAALNEGTMRLESNVNGRFKP
jgi:LPS export ABC transporter protein LptC